MTIDWSVIGSGATVFSSIATAAGVCFVAWQVLLAKKQAQAEFEDSFDQQYRALSMAIPVDVLIGKKLDEAKKDEVRELIYNYLDLSNEQVYLRKKGRVSSDTWESWCSGVNTTPNPQLFAE